MRNYFDIIEKYLGISLDEFIKQGNNNFFLEHDHELLEFIKNRNAIDLDNEKSFIGKFDINEKTFYFNFYEEKLIFIKLCYYSEYDILNFKKNINYKNSSIFGIDIKLIIKDDFNIFIALNNGINIFINDNILSIYGFNVFADREIESQIKLAFL